MKKLIIICLLFNNCTEVPNVKIEPTKKYKYSISSHKDPFTSSNNNFNAGTKYALIFNYETDDKIHPIIEKKILFIIHISLLKKGLIKVENKDSADYWVSVNFSIEEVIRTGLKTVITGKTYKTSWDGTVQTDRRSGNPKLKDTYGSQKYDYTAYIRKFNIQFINDSGVLWVSEIISEGSENDIIKVANGVLPSAMLSFPKEISGDFTTY